MLNSLKKNLIWPLAGRLGSILGGALIPYGVHAESAETVAIGVIGVLLVAVDLVGSYVSRRTLANGK